MVPSQYNYTTLVYGNTALMKASYNGHLEVVKALVAAGADVNAKTNVGQARGALRTAKGGLDSSSFKEVQILSQSGIV